MTAIGSTIPRSPSLLPTTSSQGKRATKSAGMPSALTPKTTDRRETSTIGQSSSQSHPSWTMLKTPASNTSDAKPRMPPSESSRPSQSPSKLPKSPRSRLPSSTSTDFSGKSSKAAMSQVSKYGASRLQTPPPRKSANKSPGIPSPKVIVTPSPPPAAEPSRQRAVKSASTTAPTSPAPRTLEFVPKESSPYVAAHLGEPCTTNALDHMLTCGHKVITTVPEPCVANCQTSPSRRLNTRSPGQSFVCLTCMLSAQQAKHAERVTSFKQESQQVAGTTRKAEPEKWIEMECGLLKRAWRDVEMDKIREEVREGRFAYPVCVEPGEEMLVLEIAGAALRERARKVLEAAEAAGRD